MDIVIIAAIVLLVLFTMWWVMRPLWLEPAGIDSTGLGRQQPLAELDHRRDGVYKAIKDLELDLASGKLSEADYNIQRSQLVADAADILRQIDQVSQSADEGLDARIDSLLSGFESNGARTNDALREQIRLEIRQGPTERAKTGCPQCGYLVEPDDAFCRKCGRQLQQQCPECGEAVATDDRFCSHCGAQLAVEATE